MWGRVWGVGWDPGPLVGGDREPLVLVPPSSRGLFFVDSTSESIEWTFYPYNDGGPLRHSTHLTSPVRTRRMNGCTIPPRGGRQEWGVFSPDGETGLLY